MSKKVLFLLTVIASLTSLGTSVINSEPIAEGFVNWQGVTSKAYMQGREVSASDLRHKVTIFVELESGEKLRDQLLLAAKLMSEAFIVMPKADLEGWKVPRTYIGIISCRGSVDATMIDAALTPAKNDPPDVVQALSDLKGPGCSIYRGVTFAGEPDSRGKCPYACIMGPTGVEPLWHGTLTAASLKKAKAMVVKAGKERNGLETVWRPFFGNIVEPKYHPELVNAVENAKTTKVMALDSIMKGLIADIRSKDAEKAREAQILYDAISQTRSDLQLRIMLEVRRAPYLAVADIQDLLKFWPSAKKSLTKVYKKIKAHPENESIAKIYLQIRKWTDPEFKCKGAGEAKKIIQELVKIRKGLSKFKGSQIISVQNAASTLERKIDGLISTLSSEKEK